MYAIRSYYDELRLQLVLEHLKPLKGVQSALDYYHEIRKFSQLLADLLPNLKGLDVMQMQNLQKVGIKLVQSLWI